jgi:uncharacterized protein (UPF0548 family)
VISRDSAGAVAFEVVAFSKGNDLLTRIGGPVARHLQARAIQAYLKAMRATAT